jgi:hypothetical protein
VGRRLYQGLALATRVWLPLTRRGLEVILAVSPAECKGKRLETDEGALLRRKMYQKLSSRLRVPQRGLRVIVAQATGVGKAGWVPGGRTGASMYVAPPKA